MTDQFPIIVGSVPILGRHDVFFVERIFRMSQKDIGKSKGIGM
jgi:hypothetical protein